MTGQPSASPLLPGGPALPCLRISQLATGDAETLLAVFDGLSAESRFNRFLTPMPRLPQDMLRALARVDGRTHLALVAHSVDRAAPVGIGRLAVFPAPLTGVTGPRIEAEISLAVVDEYQRRGVGRRLLRQLRRRAMVAGVTHLTGTILPQNHAIVGLLRSELGVGSYDIEDGLGTFSVPLARAATGPVAVDVA